MPQHHFYKCLLFILLLNFSYVSAQDSIRHGRNKRKSDLFSEKAQLSDSDYLEAIEGANDVINKAKNSAEFKGRTFFVFGEIKKASGSLNLVLNNLNSTKNNNVHNQQMYKRILLEVQEEMEYHRAELDITFDTLTKLKKSIRTIIKRDTILRGLIRDTVLRKEFKPELIALRNKWKKADSLITKNIELINQSKKIATEKNMIASESLEAISDRLEKSGVLLFGNEYCNLWDIKTDFINRDPLKTFQDKFSAEKKAFGYYFTYSVWTSVGMILFMGLLFWWILYNVRYLTKAGKISELTEFKFKYLNKKIILPVIVVGINVAIAFNLYAPALYFEFLNLMSLIALTVIFKSQWSNKSFKNWLWLTLLFVLFCFIDLFVKVSMLQRCVFIVINLLSIRFGMVQLKTIKEELYIKVFFRVANTLFIALNILAIVFNLFGRVSLAHTLSLTAVTALTQIIALSVFLKIVLEIIVLQVYAIRIRRGITKIFDYENLEDNLEKPLLLLVTYLWIIVIASNLDLTDAVYKITNSALTHKNVIGNFSFTFGNILLFFIIIWVAHILQRYVAYFFGEIDEENEEMINKRQHSKLLITRLLVLIIGYLLAISASGMPLDKITIVLGALGVGVGLGLQNIVSNFVSGVILIFDKPIQIGDIIEAGSQTGRVKNIGLRTTSLNTNDGAEVIIPNGNLLSQNVVNWTFSNNYKLTDISFTVTGETTHEKITEIIIASLATVPLVFMEKDPQVFFNSVSNNTFKITVKFWCIIFRTDQAVSEVRVALYNSFKNNDIVLEN